VTTAPQTPTGQLLPLNDILESAVILNWAAFGHSSDGGTVQIEYHVGVDSTIEYLKIWSSTTRGYLSLVCDYAVAWHRPNGAGARFSNGFHSRDLGRFLDSILMNQNLFIHGCRANCNVLIKVNPPSAEQVAQAKQRVDETLSLASPPPRAARVPKAAKVAAELQA
jgi:hypothetical protein